jgi:hypothetical protein
MHLVYGSLFILATIKWGDWKRWKFYYNTFLFLSVWDLIYQFLLYRHDMWKYHPSFDNLFLPNHTLIVLFWMFIIYPSMILLFLPYFPKRGFIKKALYIARWVIILVGIEVFALLGWRGITHHNGWNIGWSLILDIALFSTISIHQNNQVKAWVIAIIFTLGLWSIFNVPFEVLK